MKMRNVLWIVMALVVVCAAPVSAEEAAQPVDAALVCAAPAVESAQEEAPAEVEVPETAPPMDFLGVGLCNCTVGNPCSIPCASSNQTPTCIDQPCLSTSSLIDGVCVCI